MAARRFIEQKELEKIAEKYEREGIEGLEAKEVSAYSYDAISEQLKTLATEVRGGFGQLADAITKLGWIIGISVIVIGTGIIGIGIIVAIILSG